MKTKSYIIITFENKKYKVELESLLDLFSKLSGEKVVFKCEEQIYDYMKRYKLFDRFFLKNINKF